MLGGQILDDPIFTALKAPKWVTAAYISPESFLEMLNVLLALISNVGT
jgi:hypothetical protein